jgi:threonine/homoserine/homoserine lactone efflux protein
MQLLDSASLSPLVSIYALYLGAAMVPGPNLFVIAGASLSTSRAHGLATALGVSTGTVIFALSTLAGLSTLVTTIPALATTIRICGAAYLVCLGARALLRAVRGTPVEPPEAAVVHTLMRAYLTGLATHLSNPKAVIFYLSLMSIVVAPETSIPTQLAAAGGLIMLSLAWYGSVALALSRESVRDRYTHAGRWIDAVLGTALVGAGLRLALSSSD